MPPEIRAARTTSLISLSGAYRVECRCHRMHRSGHFAKAYEVVMTDSRRCAARGNWPVRAIKKLPVARPDGVNDSFPDMRRIHTPWSSGCAVDPCSTPREPRLAKAVLPRRRG
jgi:hypothetical protein